MNPLNIFIYPEINVVTTTIEIYAKIISIKLISPI